MKLRSLFCNVFFAFFMLLFSCNTDKEIVDNSDNDMRIRSVMKAQEEAWSEGDIDAFMQGYWNSDSLSFIGSSGVNRGWNTTLANYKKGYPNKDAMGRLQFDIIELRELSTEYYYMIGKYTLIRKEDQPSGYFTLLWKRIEGEWKIVSDQTCG